MSENMEWIKEAREHFEKISDSGLNYADNDDNSLKSKEINKKLQKLLNDNFTDDELVIDKSGNKWGYQGHKKLKNYIWYRIYNKDFTKEYPIVLNVSINKNGLNISIDIYESTIGKKISKKLVNLLKKKLKDNDEIRWQGDDYGYFGLDNLDTDKLNNIIEKYKQVVKEIKSDLDKKLEDVIDAYKEFIKNPKDNPHVLLDENNELVISRKNILENFKSFINKPIKKGLESWWDRSINSANMKGNFTNLIKNLEEKTKEEVENMSDDTILEKVNLEFKKIKEIIFDPQDSDWGIQTNLMFENVELAIKEVNGMNATAKELVYYAQMGEDKIPLVNSMTQNKVETIAKLYPIFFKDAHTLQDKFDVLRYKLFKQENGEYIRVDSLKSYYLLDQFLNLIDKVKVNETKNEEYGDLYKKAFIFKDLLGGSVVLNDDFIQLLKEGQNIIYYGAPGTGKTSGVLKDIRNTTSDEIYKYELIQFHPSYGYEDFVEGIRPIGIDQSNGSMKFELQDGEFKKFCKKAMNDEDNFNNFYEKNFKEAVENYGYFFIIDEINRAELSRVFGELLFALEYRGAEQGIIKTQYASMRNNDDNFFIPKNLFLIGTMNDVDRSIESFDLALRRRFVWIRKYCDYDVIENEIYNDKEKIFENLKSYTKSCKKLNDFLTTSKEEGLNLGIKYEIGHAYYMKISQYANSSKISQQAMNKLFDYHLSPLINEYLRSEYSDEDIEKHLKEAKKRFRLND